MDKAFAVLKNNKVRYASTAPQTLPKTIPNAAGIAVEFLEYIAPRDGRPFPRDTRSNDLWHWQTSFEADSLSDLLGNRKFEFVSSGIVSLSGNKRGAQRALIIRDPDGHAVRTLE